MIALEKDNPKPLYLQVKDGLRKEVSAGVYGGERGLPDERVLARELGLSRTTVRRAIMELTTEGVLGRIRGRGTFVRNAGAADAPSASIPDPARAMTVGVVTRFDHTDRQGGLFYERILDSLQIGLGSDATIILRKITYPIEDFAARLQASRLDAVAALGVIDPDLIGRLARLAIPTVLIDCAVSGPQPVIDEVTHDGETPAFQAVRSLVELGHRSIGVMVHGHEDDAVASSPVPGWAIGPFACERLRGCQRALHACGSALAILPVHASSTSAYARMRALLNSGDAPTAMFCTTDEIAVGVVQAVKDHGWRVPDHMSVIGFGDSGYFCTPLLSTVRIRVDLMGAEAA
nr:GntR family transcriptional regulator [Planctomycetota bacterium]